MLHERIKWYIYILTDLSAYLSLGYGWYDRSKWLILPPILKYITKKILLECIASIHVWVRYWGFFMLKREANPMKGGLYIGQFGPQKAKWGKGSTYFDMHSWGMLRTFWDTIIGVIIEIPLCILRHQSWRWQLHGTPISIYKPTMHYYCQQSFGVNTTFSRTPVWPSSQFCLLGWANQKSRVWAEFRQCIVSIWNLRGLSWSGAPIMHHICVDKSCIQCEKVWTYIPIRLSVCLSISVHLSSASITYRQLDWFEAFAIWERPNIS